MIKFAEANSMTMKTLNFALCLESALIGTASCASDGSGKKDSRPNVIFILTDDQNFQTVQTGKYDDEQRVKGSDSTFSSELYANAAIDFIDSMKDRKRILRTGHP